MAAGIGSIDASIPLSGTVAPPDYFGGVEKGMNLAALAMKPQLIQQQIAASRASQLATEAQTPGFEAQSSSFQQKAIADKQDQDARNMAIELARSGRYTTEKEDGTKGIDYARLYGDVAQKHPQQALTLAKDKGDSDYKVAQAKSQEFTTAKTEQEAKSLKAKAEDDMFELGNKQVQTLANIVNKLEGVSDEQKVEIFKKSTAGLASHYPDAYKNSPYIQWMPQLDNTGKPILDDAGKPVPPTAKVATSVTPDLIKSVAQGQIGPLASGQLEVSQGRFELDKFLASPERKLWEQGLATPEIIAGFKEKSAKEDLYVGILKDGAAIKVPDESGSLFTTIKQSAWNTLVDKGGPWAAKQRAIDAYNQKNGTQISMWASGPAAVDRMLSDDAKSHQTLSTEYGKIGSNAPVAGAPKMPGTKMESAPASATTSTEKSEPTPNKTPKLPGIKQEAGPDGKVWVKEPGANGRRGKVPYNEALNYLSNGYKEAP